MDIDSAAGIPKPFAWDTESYGASDVSIASSALKAAVDNVLAAGLNHELYIDLLTHSPAPVVAAAAITLDPAVADDLRRTAELKLATVEKELNIHRANALRDSIRHSYLELAQIQKQVGNFENAIRSLRASQEYVASVAQLLDSSFHTAECGVLAGSSHVIAAEMSKIDARQQETSVAAIATKRAMYLGIAHIFDGKYDQAAKAFLAVSPTHLDTTASVAHHEEIAMYTGLTALAGLTRSELKSLILTSNHAKQLLEPHSWLRNVIADFVAGKYRNALHTLHIATSDMACDWLISPHVPSLLSAIRQQALCQYLQPYTVVNLHSMAAAFDISVAELEGEIAGLITKDVLSAKIDADAKVLHSHRADKRTAALNAAVEAARTFEETSRMLLLKTSLTSQDIQIHTRAGAGAGRVFPGVPSGIMMSAAAGGLE